MLAGRKGRRPDAGCRPRSALPHKAAGVRWALVRRRARPASAAEKCHAAQQESDDQCAREDQPRMPRSRRSDASLDRLQELLRRRLEERGGEPLSCVGAAVPQGATASVPGGGGLPASSGRPAPPADGPASIASRATSCSRPAPCSEGGSDSLRARCCARGGGSEAGRRLRRGGSGAGAPAPSGAATGRAAAAAAAAGGGSALAAPPVPHRPAPRRPGAARRALRVARRPRHRRRPGAVEQWRSRVGPPRGPAPVATGALPAAARP